MLSDAIIRYMRARGGWRRGSLVADVGAGGGYDAQSLAAASACTVAAVDKDAGAIRHCPKGVAGDARKLPFADNVFDGAYAAFLYHLVEDKSRFLSELVRVVRKGGSVFIITTSETVIARRFVNRFFPSVEGIDLARYGTVDELASGMISAGIGKVGVTSFVRAGANPAPDFLTVVREKRWSSLRLLRQAEYEQGRRAIEAEVEKWARRGISPRWPEERVVVAGRK